MGAGFPVLSHWVASRLAVSLGAVSLGSVPAAVLPVPHGNPLPEDDLGGRLSPADVAAQGLGLPVGEPAGVLVSHGHVGEEGHPAVDAPVGLHADGVPGEAVGGVAPVLLPGGQLALVQELDDPVGDGVLDALPGGLPAGRPPAPGPGVGPELEFALVLDPELALELALVLEPDLALGLLAGGDVIVMGRFSPSENVLNWSGASPAGLGGTVTAQDARQGSQSGNAAPCRGFRTIFTDWGDGALLCPSGGIVGIAWGSIGAGRPPEALRAAMRPLSGVSGHLHGLRLWGASMPVWCD